GIGVQRDDAFTVEIVSGASVAIPIGARIADAPISEVQLRIVRAGYPYRAASGLPGVPGPGLVAGLAGSRYGIEAPDFLPGADVVGGDETADTELTPGRAYDHLVFYHQRGMRKNIAGLRPGHRRIPFDMA